MPETTENPETPAATPPATPTPPETPASEHSHESHKDPQPSPFDWRIILLALYLLVLLLLSVNWLTGMMLADTSGKDENGKIIASCSASAKANTNTAANTATNTAANTNSNTAANTNAGSNTAVNTAANTAANTGANTNTATNAAAPANTNRATNTNRPVNPPAAANANTETNKAGGNAGGDTSDDRNISTVVMIGDSCLVGCPYFSVRQFISGGCLTADGFLFFVVLFAGMLGAVIRAIVSLYWHMGRKDFSFNWIWYYLFQPFFGAALGLIFYMVLRGGFSGGSVGKGNVFAFAAVGALTGLFSDNAMAQLKKVAEALLVPTPSKSRDAKADGQSNPPEKPNPPAE